MRDKANYGGGHRGGILSGLKTKSPSVNDKSRDAIGKCYPTSVDSNPNRSEPSKQEPTIGPRTA